MAIIDVLNQKAAQYGVTFAPISVKQQLTTDWVEAVKAVNGLSNRWESVLASEIDSYIKKGTVSEPGLEKRGAKSDKVITNTSDLKYQKILKCDDRNKVMRTSLILNSKILGKYVCELVVYDKDFGASAFYVLYSNRNCVAYVRQLNNL